MHDGHSALENANDYSRQYVKASDEISKQIHGDDFVLLLRAAYTGSSKYAAFGGGDTGKGRWGLRSVIIAIQRAAVLGFPVWESDIGGYNVSNGIDRDNTARWLGFGCFCLIMEVGPTRNNGFWNLKKEPYYDAELIAIWLFYAKIHEDLMDSYTKIN